MPAVLCDVDGTLVDTTYLHTVSWWQAFAEDGVTVPMVTIRGAIGMGADRLLPHLLGSKPDAERAEAYKRRHDELFRAAWPLLRPTTGAADLLHTCAKRGVQVVLASSAGAEELGALRAAIGADDAIDGATNADDVPSSKPAPDLVHRALELAGTRPEESVFVGDTVWDIRAAHAAGIACIGLTCGGTTAAELEAGGADAVYPDPAALVSEFNASLLAHLA
jgi:HAD superfamily hydrolase (TIGR01509 family)